MDIDTKIVSLIWDLLPGFLASWVFLGLTAFSKPTPFERVVNALIFVALCKIAAPPIQTLLFWVGNYFVLADWSAESSFVLLCACGLLIGLFSAWTANNGWLHEVLRKCRITERTSFPSEWQRVFYKGQQYILLELKDGKTLYGWPREYPDDPSRGHFYLQHPQIVTLQSGEWQIETLPCVGHMLVPVSEVKWISFLDQADNEPSILSPGTTHEDRLRSTIEPILDRLQQRRQFSVSSSESKGNGGRNERRS